MESNAPAKKNKTVVIMLGVIIVLLVSVLVLMLLQRNDGEVSATSADPSLGLTYANQGVTVVEDPDALQKAVDEMYEKAAEGGIGLEYKGAANSENGSDFTCYIANSLSNKYDMFIQIFGDNALTDQLFLSGLIRPGEAFEKITLDHPLEPGTHTVYCAFTQVEDDHQTIHAQVIVTMDFTVQG